MTEDVKDDELEKLDPEVNAEEPHDEEHEDDTAKRDTELDDAESDAEREAIRERRREERKHRKNLQREKKSDAERELAALRAQVQRQQEDLLSLQSMQSGAQLAQVDQAINQATVRYQQLQQALADAVARQDGATVVRAQEEMWRARQDYEQLTNFKRQATVAQSQPRPLNPMLVNHAQEFLGKHKWYNGPQSADPDSKILSALDNSLAAEGWDATTKEYWQELETRAAKYLPHRMGKAQKRSPVADGGQGSNVNSPRPTVISAERVKAMKDAGIWDDLERRNKMIKRYQEMDRKQA